MGAIDKKEYITDGHLSVCPQRPNCVCSEDPKEDHRIAPLSFSGPAPVAWQTLQEILQDMGGQVEQSDDSFIHLTFRSSLFRFIDDVCCRLDQENRSIHIRSASRVGYSDFGVNRKRMEELRKRFVQ